MNTKERILDAALTLFNAQGTGAVSTNHIADAAGISPGNLYYHYRNKEAIIRGIFERLFAEWDSAFNLPTDHAPTLEDVRHWVKTNFEQVSRYRFIYRELLPLLRQDAELHQRYQQVRERGYTGFRELMSALAQWGVMQAIDSEDVVTRLADLCWLITEFWFSSAEVRGETVTDAHVQQGVDLMIQVLGPYLVAP